MKTRALFAMVLVASFGRVNRQVNDSAKVVISHVFFCVDSLTYQNLFKHDFIAKQFAYSRESSSKTLTDSWTGKYLNGRQSYIEVFEPNDKKTQPQLGDKFGDVGLVFRTKKPGDVNKIDARMKADKRDTHLELIKYEADGKTIPFNYNLYLTNGYLQETFMPYIEEFTMEFLKLRGFSESEIKTGITEEQLGTKRRGKNYEKLFDNIEKIELSVTQAEFEYLAETLKYVGFSRTGHRFTNNGLEILCSVIENRRYKLKAIYFSLLDEPESITIEISKNLTFSASGKKASLRFKYE